MEKSKIILLFQELKLAVKKDDEYMLDHKVLKCL